MILESPLHPIAVPESLASCCLVIVLCLLVTPAVPASSTAFHTLYVQRWCDLCIFCGQFHFLNFHLPSKGLLLTPALLTKNPVV